MYYPVILAPQPEGGFTVTFPDIPEAISQGEDVEDALLHGADALESALDFYIEDGVEVLLLVVAQQKWGGIFTHGV